MPSGHQGLNSKNSTMQPSLNLGSAARLKSNGDAQSHYVEYYHQHSTFNKGWQGNDINHKGLVRKFTGHFRRKLAASRAGSRSKSALSPDWVRDTGFRESQKASFTP